MAKKHANPRAVAVDILSRIARDGQSLSSLIPHSLEPLPAERRPLAQELCYGTLRWWHRLDWLLHRLLDKPLKAKETEIHALLLLGLYQLSYMDIPPHAAVSETVAVTSLLRKKEWARGLVNAILRRFQRERDELEKALAEDEAAAIAHPAWLLETLQHSWPQQWQEIVAANNERPPMTLRVNRSRQSRDVYLDTLANAGIHAHPSEHATDALTLERPLTVEQLPGFAEGLVSVQDAAAQLAAPLLEAKAGMRVLDACAAPGGKTGHLLELSPDIDLFALDVDERRLERVAENLSRLGVNAKLLTADAGAPDSWWDGQAFDRILLDAPCSASGVIRRHPDIKLLRRAEDIDQLVQLQASILNALWPLLRPGGILVYATCSVFPRENSEQLANFLTKQEDAVNIPLEQTWGQTTAIGRQILPGQDGMDGFYYACIGKQL